MRKNIRKRILSASLTLFMTQNLILSGALGTLSAMAASTPILIDFTAKISQNETEIVEGGTLTSNDPISIEISFGVPVQGDNPTPDTPVQKGDTVTFELSSAFKVISSDIMLKPKLLKK